MKFMHFRKPARVLRRSHHLVHGPCEGCARIGTCVSRHVLYGPPDLTGLDCAFQEGCEAGEMLVDLGGVLLQYLFRTEEHLLDGNHGGIVPVYRAASDGLTRQAILLAAEQGQMGRMVRCGLQQGSHQIPGLADVRHWMQFAFKAQRSGGGCSTQWKERLSRPSRGACARDGAVENVAQSVLRDTDVLARKQDFSEVALDRKDACNRQRSPCGLGMQSNNSRQSPPCPPWLGAMPMPRRFRRPRAVSIGLVARLFMIASEP